MTQKELKNVLKSMIKNKWIVFKDETDSEYILSLLKSDTWEDIINAMEVCELKQGQGLWDELKEEDY